MANHRRFYSLFLLFGVLLSFAVGSAFGSELVIRVGNPPPPLPVYVQPDLPAAGYIWVPGYWAWAHRFHDFYWVPGTWVLAPREGYLWTPAWWGWDQGQYVFHDGYWSRHVGFYGGIAYGFGYGGVGYDGGRWENGEFLYNDRVNHLGTVHVRTFSRDVVTRPGQVSFNGGAGGITARASAEELRADKENHLQATERQNEHKEGARGDESLRFSSNHGNPAKPATALPRTASSAKDEVKKDETHADKDKPAKEAAKPKETEKPHETHAAEAKDKPKPAATHAAAKHEVAKPKPPVAKAKPAPKAPAKKDAKDKDKQ